MSDEVVILQGGSKSKISDEQAASRGSSRALRYEDLFLHLRCIFGERCGAPFVESTPSIHGARHRVEFELEQHGLMTGDQLESMRSLLEVASKDVFIRVNDNTLRISVINVYTFRN